MKKAIPSVLLMTFMLMTNAIMLPGAIAHNSTWAIMWGQIQLYGGAPALGFVFAEAEIDAWARVIGAFIPGITGPPFALSLPFSFYLINLTSTTTAKLNYSGNAFYVDGSWNVYNVTVDIGSINTSEVVVGGSGNLSVTTLSVGSDFTINITGINLIKGIVLYEDPSETIPKGDVNTQFPSNRTVDIFDLVRVAKAYESNVTSPNYWGIYGVAFKPLRAQFFVDLNFDWYIDILDLVTVAANIGETY